MEGIIAIIFILLLICIIVFVNSLKKIQTKLDILGKQIDNNQKFLKSISDFLHENNPSFLKDLSHRQPLVNLDLNKEVSFQPPSPIEEVKPIEAEVDINSNSKIDIPEKVIISFPDDNITEIKPLLHDTKPPKPQSKKPVIDWEKFIGENLINKIGIAILTIGIGIFVKFAIDNHWINEIGRVCIGFLAGGILLSTAHYLRHGYKAFSSVLVGGGIATLYFTIGIAFHEYQLINQTVAFVSMSVITLFAIALSLSYQRIELAVIALIGGFSTPFIVSTGEGNYVILFSYLLILNTGMLLLSYFKKWNLVFMVAYVFTIIIFAAWFFTQFQKSQLIGTLCFATAFYLLFFTAATTFNIRKKLSFVSFDFFAVLSLNCCYYSIGIEILSSLSNGVYKGIFTLLLAIINFILAYLLIRRQSIDKNFIYLIIAVVLSYVTLIAPVQLNGNQITLFWAAEAVILLWLSQKSSILLLKVASFILWPLMIISLVGDWVKHYDYQINDVSMWPIINQPFITGLGVLVAMGLFNKFLIYEKDPLFYSTSYVQIKKIINAAMVALGFLVGFLEVNYQSKASENNYEAIYQFVADYAFIGSFLAVLWIIVIKKQLLEYGYTALIASGWYFLILIIIINGKIIETRNMYLFSKGHPIGFFLTHYIITVGVGIILANLYKFINQRFKSYLEAGIWVLGAAVIYSISTEIDHAWVLFNGPTNETLLFESLKISQKVLYPIVWGLTSFVIMYIGLKQKLRQLRIFSLTLLGVILLKLFTIDILDMSPGGRIAAFISLGLLLLIISFLYQKLKKLVLENE